MAATARARLAGRYAETALRDALADAYVPAACAPAALAR
jgi:hypothetical protein